MQAVTRVKLERGLESEDVDADPPEKRGEGRMDREETGAGTLNSATNEHLFGPPG